MGEVVVLSGAGRWADPWHDFAATSDAICRVLREAGLGCEVRPSTTPDVLDGLDGVRLLVVNTGAGPRPDEVPPEDPGWVAAQERLGGWITAGQAVLACHTAAAAFPGWQSWPALLGGRWVRGVSGHPPLSQATFRAMVGQQKHPFFAGLKGCPPEVTAWDERYSRLHVAPDSRPVLCHETDGALEVMGWTRGRVVYDGMGHDERSYASPSRRRYLLNEVQYLLDGTSAS